MIIFDQFRTWYKKRHPEYVLNINLDLLDKTQKRVLLCYIKDSLRINYDGAAIYHPNKLRANQMVTALIRLGYAVDVCDFNDMDVLPKLQQRHYDAIIGFGPLYEAMCETTTIPVRIIYVTENDPRLVGVKYGERKEYFRQRHPEIKKIPTSDRIQYYTPRQYQLSNRAIIMTCECNSAEIRKEIPHFATLKVNGMKNECFVFNRSGIDERRKNFLWFGSTGYVQKGLDILIDVFAQLPDYNLNVYGLPDKEIKQLCSQMQIPRNVRFGGMVSVQSQDFMDIVNKNLFIISASCMEGMQSGVATCMRHGMIPLLTKECGYEAEDPVVLFDDYMVESILDGIKTIEKKNSDELADFSERIFNYAECYHTLGSISKSFSQIFKSMIES